MKRKYLNLLTLVCLVVCLALSVGVAYGRFQWEFPQMPYLFTPELPDNLFLCGSVSEDWLDHGNLPELSDQWMPDGDGVKKEFGVTNGYAQLVSRQEQIYTVRLAVSLGVEDPTKLTVTLSWRDSQGEIHQETAEPVPIAEGTTLHTSFGDGWVYRFLQDGQEVKFSLPGGELAYANYAITVAGDVEPVMLDVQIIGQDTK